MTLEQLRIFVAVAERQHVTRAAQALRLTQSAVSAAIASLEARHGVALFHRVGRGVVLSDDGRLFLEEAQAVLLRAAAAEQALSELAGLKRGTLTIEASQTIASYWLPARIVAFRKAYPLIAVRLSIANTQQVAKAVARGETELGFVEGKVEMPALASTRVARDRLVIVVSPQHPWARLRRLAPGTLADGLWVLREEGSGTRSEFEAGLRSRGLAVEKMKVALELPSNEAVCAAVQAGAGATAISELVVSASLASGALVAVPFQLPERDFHALRLADRYCSRAARAFVLACTARKGEETQHAPARKTGAPGRARS